MRLQGCTRTWHEALGTWQQAGRVIAMPHMGNGMEGRPQLCEC